MARPEHQLQCAVVRYLRLALPGAVIFAIPNAGKRSKVGGAMEKEAGLLPGMPDLCVIYNRGVMFIELKAPAGLLSAAQKNRIAELMDAGIPVAVCRSLGDVYIFLLAAGVGPKARPT